MAEEPAYIRNLRAITRADPTPDNLEALETELYAQGNDRATGILFGSFVERSLQRLISTILRSDLNSKDRKLLFEHEGALANFSNKIVMAYALGLVGPVSKADLDLIRFLRNEFAHSRVSFSFETPEVAAVCAKLKIVNEPHVSIPLGYLQRVPRDLLEAASDLTHPRTRYIASCHNLAHRMLVKRTYPQEGDFVYPNDEPLP